MWIKLLYVFLIGLCGGFVISNLGQNQTFYGDTSSKYESFNAPPEPLQLASIGNFTGTTTSTTRATPIGSMGPKGTTRENLLYYDSLFYLSMQFGRDARSLLEVGCANDPFSKYLTWIDDKTCVAPYFEKYDGKATDEHDGEVAFIEADYMKYEEPKKYDFLLCSQVVEHVPDPAAFMKKLIRAAKTSIISVPYMWPKCREDCGHISNFISLETVEAWTAPYKPILKTIITEPQRKTRMSSRLVLVFQNDD